MREPRVDGLDVSGGPRHYWKKQSSRPYSTPPMLYIFGCLGRDMYIRHVSDIDALPEQIVLFEPSFHPALKSC